MESVVSYVNSVEVCRGLSRVCRASVEFYVEVSRPGLWWSHLRSHSYVPPVRPTPASTGGPRCIIRVPGPDTVPDVPITHLLPSHGHRQTRLQLKASEAPRGRFQLGAARGSACKMSAASWPFAIEKPREHASWGGRSKLAAASFGSCAGGLKGPQRSGACCDART